ncbi:chemotaxis protein CheW [Thermodesulforhabdus norvegica]|uniref:Purine-binding chemotaxis protein CheW n=1 Tax=Thermodesulforhabdus norvegica TaxID=39841 RepID=A0A1I4V6H9_9BACT|nr:chemotaxis protein CheW [Thermodesulforhabdus norvegica]SFM96590.1 purine-binding chemotaxis protein CheW [Thermodesulforhabdus norvegica]
MWTDTVEEQRAERREKTRQLITFSVSEEEFAVDISQVQEVIRLPNITVVPNAPDFIEGVIHLRGRIVPVIDLRKRLRLSRSAEPVSYDKYTRVLIILHEGKLIGFIVDKVTEILKIPESAVRPTPELVLEHTGAEYFDGVVREDDRLIILLNLQRVLAPVEREQLEQIDIEAIKKLLQQHLKEK